ncbi:esterase [Xylariaceae sp. FL0255]|nr:esterase [Xylariaceae sp. FL0255]
MVRINEKPVYFQIPADFKPGPKNGHMSEKHPVYAGAEKQVAEGMKQVWAGTLEQARSALASMPVATPERCPEPGKDVLISQKMVPVRDGAKVEIQIYKSPKVEPDAALVLHFHGGGWTVGGHFSEEAEHRYLGALPNVVAASVDYRMAPEHPYPIPANDCYDVLKWCKANASNLGINPERIILAGDSAGGNLTLITALKARDEGLTGIVAMKLAFPSVLHPKFMDQVPNKENYELLSMYQNCDDVILSGGLMETFLDFYVGKDPKPDPGHSPLLAADLSNLPPALVVVAGADPLRDEGIAVAERLKAAGGDVQLEKYSGLPHCFNFLFAQLPETKKAFDDIIAFVRKYAEGGRSLL